MRKLLVASFLLVFIPACGSRPDPVFEAQVILLLEPDLLPSGEYSFKELRSYLHRTTNVLTLGPADSDIFSTAGDQLEGDWAIPRSYGSKAQNASAWLRDNVRLTTGPPDSDELARICVSGTSNDEDARRVAFAVATAMRDSMIHSWKNDLSRKISAGMTLIESEESRLKALAEEALKCSVSSLAQDEAYRDLLLQKLAEVRLELAVARAASSFDTLPKGEFDAFAAGPPDPAATAAEEAIARVKHTFVSLVLEADELNLKIEQLGEAQQTSARIQGEIRHRNARLLELREQRDRCRAVQKHNEPRIVMAESEPHG